MHEFFNMHGYGYYIWGAYGFAAIMLVGLTLQTIMKGRKKK